MHTPLVLQVVAELVVLQENKQPCMPLQHCRMQSRRCSL
jgi:hypothetical protein